MMKVPTSELHGALRELIRGMRSPEGKRFAPRTVEFNFCVNSHASVNGRAFSLNAYNGQEARRDPPEAWLGDDGEPNYRETIYFDGPAVSHWGHGRNAIVYVHLPIGSEGDHWRESDCFRFYTDRARAGDWHVFRVAVDAVLDGRHPPYTRSDR